MALGASAHTVVGMLLTQSLSRSAGVALGVLGGFGEPRPRLHALAVADPLVLGIAALMLAVALVAAWVPVLRRASIWLALRRGEQRNTQRL